MAEPRPDSAYLRSLHKHLLDIWQPAHANWEETDSYINSTFPVWDRRNPQHANRIAYRPSTGYNIVTHAADTLMVNEAKVSRQPRSDSQTAQLRSSEIENWLKEVFDDASLKEPVLPFAMAKMYMVAYGYAVVETGIDRSCYPIKPKEGSRNYEEKMEEYNRMKRNVNPFHIKAPHPSEVLLPYNTKEPKYAVRQSRWLGDDIERMTRVRAERPKRLQPQNQGGMLDLFDAAQDRFRELECWELWTPDWHAMFLSQAGQMLFVEPNTWGFVPFTHSFAGWGIPLTGNNGTFPEMLARGIIDPIKQGVKLQAQRVSAEIDLLLKAAYPPLMTSMDAQEVQTMMQSGGIVGGPGIQQGDLWWLRAPDAPGRLSNVGEWIDSRDIELGTYSLSLAGLRQEGVSTVGQQAILSESAMRRFQVLHKQMNYMASVTGKYILNLMDVGMADDDEVIVNGRSLIPAHLDHSYDVDVTFEMVDQVLQMQIAQQLFEAHSRELVSAAHVRKFGLRIEDEEGMAQQIRMEAVERLPAVQLRLNALAARRLGHVQAAEDLEAEAARIERETQEQQQQEGTPAGPEGGMITPPPGTSNTNGLRQGITNDVFNPNPYPGGGGM